MTREQLEQALTDAEGTIAGQWALITELRDTINKQRAQLRAMSKSGGHGF
jgi:uncharacterized coiled-coil protein SlyX